MLNKLCSPFCLHCPFSPLEHLIQEDLSSLSPHVWLDNPFIQVELDTAIDSCGNNFAPGLDQFDYRVIRALPSLMRSTLLNIYNEMYEGGLFPDFWRDSLVIFVPKPSGSGLRPIALMSCLLKLFEKMIYCRFSWFIETQFLLSEFQAGFRSSRSCTDNLVTLTNRIQQGFLRRSSIIAVFLDIAGAFDNVIPSILMTDLRECGFPVRFCKFVENLLSEGRIFLINNGTLRDPLTTHKGTPQGSILSPILFNLYLRKIASTLHSDTNTLQYADDVVLFSSLQDNSDSQDSLTKSLESLHAYLSSRELDLAPHKSKSVIFSRRRNNQIVFQNISLQGVDIPWADSVRFLGVILDGKLNGKLSLRL